MKEIFFTVKVFVLTLVIIVLMQVEFEGKSIETRASTIFGRSETIDWIRSNTRYALNKVNNKFIEVKKVNQKTPLEKMIKNTPDLNNISEIDFENSEDVK